MAQFCAGPKAREHPLQRALNTITNKKTKAAEKTLLGYSLDFEAQNDGPEHTKDHLEVGIDDFY